VAAQQSHSADGGAICSGREGSQYARQQALYRLLCLQEECVPCRLHDAHRELLAVRERGGVQRLALLALAACRLPAPPKPIKCSHTGALTRAVP
jgi:hypothetical protein